MAENPPAFPHVLPDGGGTSGMSLRDWFAGQALTAILDGPESLKHFERASVMLKGKPVEEIIASTAYKLADAMLLARTDTPTGGKLGEG